MQYGEAILAKMQKLEKTMIKYSSYTNHLRFSLCSHHNKILPNDVQPKSRIKTKQSKTILQLKGKILESKAHEEFHLVEKTHQNLFKIFFDLVKKRYIHKFDELNSKNKVTGSTTNIIDKRKWVINMSSKLITHIETNLAKGLNFSITSKTLPSKDIATIEAAVKELEKDKADTICAKISLTLPNSKPPKG